ncbi:MAG: hypothetical protein AAGM38_17455, partial [Pseudomonadota bacterium]
MPAETTPAGAELQMMMWCPKPVFGTDFTTYTEFFPMLIGDETPIKPTLSLLGAQDATGGL